MQRFVTAIVFAVLALGLALRTDVALAQNTTIHKIEVGGGELNVRLPRTVPKPAERAIRAWIKKSAEAVTLYYGRFPVPAVDIYVNTFIGGGVQGGRAFGGEKPHITISAGTLSSPKHFDDDWRMVHELVHLAIPILDEKHLWLAEGLAVYVESIARLQAGHLRDAKVWGEFAVGMEQGLPQAGDKGLDFTPTWGRTYWGGAIFCLIADLEIRKRTKGKKNLQNALRGILSAGGNYRTTASIRYTLGVADEATGTTVLTDLYEKWRATPVDPKLPDLWKRLGVKVEGRRVSLNDKAELAGVRKKIGERPQS